MKKAIIAFGTRPDAIKMCPLVKGLQQNDELHVITCVSGQHDLMLRQILEVFDIIPDYDLGIMKEGQTLFDITGNILESVKSVLEKERPDIVLVHGDTSTAFAISLACFYLKIPVGHVEAGLRTYDLDAPWPEEFNRETIGTIAKLHFCPTENARQNLINEGKASNDIFVTGNTVIDALAYTVRNDYRHELLDWSKGSRLILLTAHRRENHGQPLKNIFKAVRRVIEEHTDCKLVYPIHPNPAVRELAVAELNGIDRIKLIEPLDAIAFHNVMSRSYLIMTDSGGIQEEAPTFGVPVLVLRDTTERPEGIEAGTLKLVGADEERIVSACRTLLSDESEYRRMAMASNPYGDGTASKQIADILVRWLNA